MFWVLARGAQVGRLKNVLGLWWGTYCVPDVEPWRKGERISQRCLN